MLLGALSGGAGLGREVSAHAADTVPFGSEAVLSQAFSSPAFSRRRGEGSGTPVQQALTGTVHTRSWLNWFPSLLSLWAFLGPHCSPVLTQKDGADLDALKGGSVLVLIPFVGAGNSPGAAEPCHEQQESGLTWYSQAPAGPVSCPRPRWHWGKRSRAE